MTFSITRKYLFVWEGIKTINYTETHINTNMNIFLNYDKNDKLHGSSGT